MADDPITAPPVGGQVHIWPSPFMGGVPGSTLLVTMVTLCHWMLLALLEGSVYGPAAWLDCEFSVGPFLRPGTHLAQGEAVGAPNGWRTGRAEQHLNVKPVCASSREDSVTWCRTLPGRGVQERGRSQSLRLQDSLLRLRIT